MRKPMTTKDLVQKFKSRNANMTKEQMTTTIAQILKRINPVKTKVNDKLYLSIKKDSWYEGYVLTDAVWDGAMLWTNIFHVWVIYWGRLVHSREIIDVWEVVAKFLTFK